MRYYATFQKPRQSRPTASVLLLGTVGTAIPALPLFRCHGICLGRGLPVYSRDAPPGKDHASLQRAAVFVPALTKNNLNSVGTNRKGYRPLGSWSWSQVLAGHHRNTKFPRRPPNALVPAASYKIQLVRPTNWQTFCASPTLLVGGPLPVSSRYPLQAMSAR